MRDPRLQTVGLRIREVRRERQISQEKLARLVEMSKETVLRVEFGRTDMQLSTLLRIADALGIDPADLLNGRKRGA